MKKFFIKTFLYLSILFATWDYSKICNAEGISGQAERIRGIGVTLWQIAIQGGPVMIPIVMLSIFVVALGFYCLFAIRRKVIVSENFISNIIKEIKDGSLYRAITMCQFSAPLVGEAILPALLKADRHVNSSKKDDINKDERSLSSLNLPSIRENIEAEGSRVASRLRQRVAWFSHVGIIAPMLGLLGTVFGMIRAFSAIAYKVEFGKPLLLASAISEAMVTTAGGLIVGIFSMILFFFFHSKANKIICDMEAGSEDIADAINMAINKSTIS